MNSTVLGFVKYTVGDIIDLCSEHPLTFAIFAIIAIIYDRCMPPERSISLVAPGMLWKVWKGSQWPLLWGGGLLCYWASVLRGQQQVWRGLAYPCGSRIKGRAGGKLAMFLWCLLAPGLAPKQYTQGRASTVAVIAYTWSMLVGVATKLSRARPVIDSMAGISNVK
eukprot:1141271-Pelagomonas_calceolata.AAC.4